MPPRIPIPTSLPLRRRIKPPTWRIDAPLSPRPPQRSYAADKSKDLPIAPAGSQAETPETSHNLHVSEEAAAMSKIMGEEGPDLSQGTPVADLVKGVKEAEEKLPRVMQEQLKSESPPGTGKRSFSTMARQSFNASSRRNDPVPSLPGASNEALQSDAILSTAQSALDQAKREKEELARFARSVVLKEAQARGFDYRERYNDIVEQFVGLMTIDGKKARAQRYMTYILNHLRTSPAPTLSPTRPLLPGAPPPALLPLNPVLYVTLAIDSIAPLMRIKNVKGIVGGGNSLPIPVPLAQRQRRRTAMTWVLDAATKRGNRGSGKAMFPHRVAEELISVVQGSSAIWEKRTMLHKTSVMARANVGAKRRKGKR